MGKHAKVVARRWKGWPGVPQRVIIDYDPVAKEHDPGWRQAALEAVQRRLAIDVRITKHDQRRRRLIIDAAETQPEPDANQERVARTIKDLFEQEARVSDITISEGAVSQVAVQRIPTTKVASSPGYRTKVERTFGTVHQGCWRCKWDLQSDSVLFQVRPEFPKMVALPRLDVDPDKDVLRAYDKVAIAFGVTVNRPGFRSVLQVRMESMNQKYSPEMRERALRMLEEAKPEHPNLMSALRHVAGLLGMSPETLRVWHRRREIDAGQRPGVPTDVVEENKRLRRENAELKKANEVLKAASVLFVKELDRP